MENLKKEKKLCILDLETDDQDKRDGMKNVLLSSWFLVDKGEVQGLKG